MPFNSKFQSEQMSEEESAEAGVRRALGLDVAVRRPERSSQYQRTAAQSSASHSKTGSSHANKVDVVVVQARRGHGLHVAEPHSANISSALNRLQVAETALKTERDARENAERSLSELQKTVHELQTKIGHTELAAVEVRHALQQMQNDLQSAEMALLEERSAKAAAEADLQQLRAAQKVNVVERHEAVERIPVAPFAKTVAPALRAATPAPVATASVAKSRKSTATAARIPKPKLVKWWIKAKDAPK